MRMLTHVGALVPSFLGPLTCALVMTVMLTPTPSALALAPANTAKKPDSSAVSDGAALAARDSAAVLAKGRWQVGIFNPLAYGLTDTITIETHPLILAASPNFTVRHASYEIMGWRVSHEYSLSMPYLAMTKQLPVGLGGYFFPACKVTAADPSKANSCDQAGLILVPSLGGKASFGSRNIWTVRAEISIGVPLSGKLGRPLEHIPPADLLFAPATYGSRTRIGVRYDHAIGRTMRMSGELNGYLVGPSELPRRNPFTLTAHWGFDIALSAHSRFTIGLLYMNSDQRRKVVEEVDGRPQRVPVRSHDVYPTIDFIFGG